jgi:hypothetical protein
MISSNFVHTKVQTTKLTVLNQTFAHIRMLSNQLPDQPRADRAMHQLLCTNIKLTRKVLTKNVIRTIMKRNIGTIEVEKYVGLVCKQNVKKKRNVPMIRYTMKMKLDDAEFDENMIRKQFKQKLREYEKTTIRGSPADVEFRRIMKLEVEDVWIKGKLKNIQKVKRLVEKYAPTGGNGNIRDVIVADEKLNEMNDNIGKDVKRYGGVTINDEEEAALKLDPEYRVYKRIDEVDLEVEIEKGSTKARYHFMCENNNNNQNATQDNNNNDDNTKEFDIENKVANYGNIRATDLPTVQRLFPPKPSTIRREVIMQSVKDKMLNKVREFKDKNCNDKGFVKKGNISNTVSNLLNIINPIFERIYFLP